MGSRRKQQPPKLVAEQHPDSRLQEASLLTGPEGSLFAHFEQRVRPCIDLVDTLRALGVEQDLALPAIAVIGDQSSGKSSVLEALSGVALPRGSGIVTRCPLVLKLKKLPAGLEWTGTLSYRGLALPLQAPSHVEAEIHKAQNLIAGSGVGISHELISLDISSPDVPDLTLIDLPGITRVAVGNQPQDIGMQIKSLIRKYIQREQTINLVVVPCNVDIATTEALSMAREVDPNGDRTLGILTKPDLVDRGTEQNVVNVVRNRTYHLKKGYMVVRCRGQQDIMNNLSLAEANKKEVSFFEEHSHFRVLLEEGKASVPLLAEKLTSELILHITKSLPALERQVLDSHQRALEELQLCGTSIPDGEGDRVVFLIEKVKAFNQHVEKLMDGEEVVRADDGRLYNDIRKEFKSWEQVLVDNMKKVRSVVQDEVSRYEKRYRGRELPGFVSYKTFEGIVQRYLERLVEPALATMRRASELVAKSFLRASRDSFGQFANLLQVVQNKIQEIKGKQEAGADAVIRLQFRMEQQVYCGDQVYGLALGQAREEGLSKAGQPPAQLLPAAAKDITPISSFSEIGVHLNAYFLETSKRLANQIPLIVSCFVLRDSGDCLQRATLQVLREKDHYGWLLQEQSEVAARREQLKQKVFRLSQAYQALDGFSRG